MAEAFEGVRSGPGGFEQRVCVKRVLPAYAGDGELSRLFQREARLAASLSHRNIVRVVDFGEDRGGHYLALELIDGLDLRRLLKAAGPLPLRVAALVGMELADALDHAHTRGGKTGVIVHRDVSPANVLLSTDGDVRLTDFGISKALGEAPVTRTDFVRGNVWYMAPEQIAGARPDPRGDLYSLGVVLYQCVSGKKPQHGPTDLAAMLALSEGRHVPLHEAAPGAPRAIVELVEGLLRRDPAERIASAAAVSLALAPLSDRGARVELRSLVRRHRSERPKARALAALAPITLPVTESPPDASPATRVARPPAKNAKNAPNAAVPQRWAPYAIAPRAWASIDAAAEERRRRGRPLPARGADDGARAPEERGGRGRPLPTRAAGDASTAHAPVEATGQTAATSIELPMRKDWRWTVVATIALAIVGVLTCLLSALS